LVVDEEVDVVVVVALEVVAADEEAEEALVTVADVGELAEVAEAARTVVASETSRARSRLFKSQHDEDCMRHLSTLPHTAFIAEC